MTTDLQARVAGLVERGRRCAPARGGADGWGNFVQHQILDERDYLTAVLTEVIADFHRQLLDEVKALLDTALTVRVRGTFQSGTRYVRGDVVSLDGASWLARQDDPGKCPGVGWQLMARQGQRGIAGPKGERGPPGKTISGWVVDRENFRITPRMSDGSLGPALDLRTLFEPSEAT